MSDQLAVLGADCIFKTGAYYLLDENIDFTNDYGKALHVRSWPGKDIKVRSPRGEAIGDGDWVTMKIGDEEVTDQVGSVTSYISPPEGVCTVYVKGENTFKAAPIQNVRLATDWETVKGTVVHEFNAGRNWLLRTDLGHDLHFSDFGYAFRRRLEDATQIWNDAITVWKSF